MSLLSARPSKSAKFDERAIKMYYVGRGGSRIYLMWDSVVDRVYRTSSVKWAKHDLHEITHHRDEVTTDPFTIKIPYITESFTSQ